MTREFCTDESPIDGASRSSGQQIVLSIVTASVLAFGANGPAELLEYQPLPGSFLQEILAPLPAGACAESPLELPADSAVQQAAGCLSMKHGDIALVFLTKDPGQAEAIAANIEYNLGYITGYAVDPDITVVVPTPELEQAATEALSDEGCVEATSLPADTAEQNMPLLVNEYDATLAITNAPHCRAGVLGTTNISRRRTANIFEANDFGSESFVTGAAANEKNASNIAEAAIHEILHLFRLEHTGNVVRTDADGKIVAGGEAAMVLSNEHFDLYGYATSGSVAFSPYGDSDVMGGVNELSKVRDWLNPLHQEVLLEDRLVLNSTPPLGIPIGREQLPLSYTDADTSRYAVIALPQPLELYNISSKQAEVFDKIAVIPEFMVDAEGRTMLGASVSLVGDNSSIAELTTLIPMDQAEDYSVGLGDETLNVRITANDGYSDVRDAVVTVQRRATDLVQR